MKSEQALKAVARYADGTTRDVTGMALFESNDDALAEVGVVGGLGAAGEAAGAIAGGGVVTQGARWGVGGGAVVQEVAVDGVGDESAPGGVGGQ